MQDNPFDPEEIMEAADFAFWEGELAGQKAWPAHRPLPTELKWERVPVKRTFRQAVKRAIYILGGVHYNANI